MGTAESSKQHNNNNNKNASARRCWQHNERPTLIQTFPNLPFLSLIRIKKLPF